MDFTYIAALVIGAALAILLSCISLLVSFFAKSRIPHRYRTYIIIPVVIFAAAVSLRWTDWRTILFTTFGLIDLFIILAFAAFGGLLGTLPLRFFRRKQPTV